MIFRLVVSNDSNHLGEITLATIKAAPPITVYLGAFGSAVMTTAYTIPLSTPVVVSVRRIGTSISLYCDGVLKASTTLGALTKKTRTLYIGHLPGVAISFGGTIDDFTWVNS